jgi:cytochrome c biogenesis protein CcdA
MLAVEYRDETPRATWDSQGRHGIWSLAPHVLCVYGVGTVIGLVGLLSLVAQNIHDPTIRNITIIFGALTAFAGIICFLFFYFPHLPPTIKPKDFKRRPSAESAAILSVVTLPASLPAAMLVLAALYSDWILGALARDLVGVPSGDTAILSWVSSNPMKARPVDLNSQQIYFGAKRLPLLLS